MRKMNFAGYDRIYKLVNKQLRKRSGVLDGIVNDYQMAR